MELEWLAANGFNSSPNGNPHLRFSSKIEIGSIYVSLSHSHAPTWRMDGNGCMKSLHQFKLRALTRDMRNKSIEASLCDIKASSSCQWPLWMAYVSTRIQFRAFLVEVNSCIHRIPISHKNGCFSLALYLSHMMLLVLFMFRYSYFEPISERFALALFFPIHVISAWKAICLLLWMLNFPEHNGVYFYREKKKYERWTYIHRAKKERHTWRACTRDKFDSHGNTNVAEWNNQDSKGA